MPSICFDHTMNASVEEIEKDPHAYLHRVLEGETVVVFEKDQAVAEIRPLAKRAKKVPLGLAKGDFVVPDDFDDPLPEDVASLWLALSKRRLCRRTPKFSARLRRSRSACRRRGRRRS